MTLQSYPLDERQELSHVNLYSQPDPRSPCRGRQDAAADQGLPCCCSPEAKPVSGAMDAPCCANRLLLIFV